MDRRARLRSVLALAALVVVWVDAGVSGAEEPAEPPRGTSLKEAPPLPFWLAGTVLAPPHSAAAIVVLDEAGRPVGSVLVKEGDLVQGYRLVEVRDQEALFEREGQTVSVRLGGPAPAPADDARGAIVAPGSPATEVTSPRMDPARSAPTIPEKADAPAPRRRVRVAPPGSSDREEEAREWAKGLMDQLRDDPKFKELIESLRRSPQQGAPQPGPQQPPASLTPPPAPRN